MKTYWKNFGIGAVALFVVAAIAGTVIDKMRGYGDAAGAFGQLWVYIVFFGILYSLIARPWRKKGAQAK